MMDHTGPQYSDAPSLPTATPLRFILLGDVHVYRLAVAPWHLLGKRLLGQLNLWLNRRARLRVDLLPQLIEHMTSLEPDMLLCTGDLTTTALPAEFQLALQQLTPILEKTHAFITPGNHDRYSFTSARTKRFEQTFSEHTSMVWPYHHEIADHLHLVAFDAARPTFTGAHGALTERQLRAFDDVIAPHIPEDDRIIAMCHYPIGTPRGHKAESRSHALRDVPRLVRTLSLPNDVLYVHGHVHQPWCWRHPDAPNIVAINAGAPVLAGKDFPAGQGFWEISIDPTHDQPWQLTHHLMDEQGQWRILSVAVPGEPGESAKLR